MADERDLHSDTHTGDGMCERMKRVYCGCVSYTVKSRGEGLIFGFGLLWRRRAQEMIRGVEGDAKAEANVSRGDFEAVQSSTMEKDVVFFREDDYAIDSNIMLN
ncbi:hypothetical protein NC653_039653 [Populus alba x Populus x berolinensis]|uniref:Uncharacterized protein n=1 Tax=Populus alba x Populus x berolinensis TaxID=444605 RepID=A0AAD6LBQ7_9ROSI|nr:hypothetical protein NC653_039653 [Populus alba x Populus x berolinensis]